jgi:hypothetical protein
VTTVFRVSVSVERAFETRISLIFTNSICVNSWNSWQKFCVRLMAGSLANFSW